MTINWKSWENVLVQALDHSRQGLELRDLFAEGGTFQDPAHEPTTDIAAVTELTSTVFPDWRQEIVTFRHGDDWAAFEWVGHASFAGTPDGKGEGAPVRLEGMTVVTVDPEGCVLTWRDYLDRSQAVEQITAAVAG